MAVDNLINDSNQGEISESMVLDTFMYTNPGDFKYTGRSINYITRDIIKDYAVHPENYTQGEYQAALNVQDYINNGHSDFGRMIMKSHSDNYGSDCFGAYAATFKSTNGDIYVACRGTGDGRWFDNGDGFAAEASLYQKAASTYFDRSMKTLGVDENTNVIITGHSKGGNIAQFIALDSKYANLVDKVYSFDGQGFSPEAIDFFKNKLGAEEYKQIVDKMYSISGDNDYVNVLGNKIISEDHTVYIDTGNRIDVYDLQNSHALYTENKNDASSTAGNLFDFKTGEFYTQTAQQRELAVTAKQLCVEIMKLPIAERREICRALMSMLELGMGDTYKYDLLGRKASFEEYLGFFEHVDDIVDVLTKTQAGRNFVDATVDQLMANFLKGDHSDFARVAALAAYAFYKKHADGVLKVVSGIGKVVSFGANVIRKIKNVFDGAVEKGKKFLNGIKDFCSNVVHSVGTAYHAVKNSITGAIDAIKEFLRDHDTILLDESAFNKAINDFNTLQSEIAALRSDVEAALNALHSGFDTPAGEVFMNSCRNNLLEPINREEKVITSISSTLEQVRGKYTSVFSEYEHLTQSIAACQR